MRKAELKDFYDTKGKDGKENPSNPRTLEILECTLQSHRMHNALLYNSPIEETKCKQVIRVKNSWGLPPHALESLAKHWSVSAQLNIH